LGFNKKNQQKKYSSPTIFLRKDIISCEFICGNMFSRELFVASTTECMFGSTSGAARIDFGRVQLILTCLVSPK
jgi:hypothetical protein